LYCNSAAEAETAPDLVTSEGNLIRNQRLLEHMLRTAPPDTSYNCHGWVFAAGKFWVKGQEVQAILDDNGYREVSTPRPNDVAVFRDDVGNILHTGLVRTASEDGLILIESKWGTLGRYIHMPQDQVYAASCSYYRSSRQSHALHGLGGETPTPAVPA